MSHVYSGAGPGWARLAEAAGRATASGLAEAASRAFINLVECALDLRLLQRADHYVQAAMAALGDRDFDVMRRVLEIRLAELAFARGRWAEAEEAVDRLAGRPRTANRVLVRTLTLCGRLLARSGRGDPWPALDRALALVGEGELQEIMPLRTAIAEAALLEGGHAARRAADEAASGLALARIPPSGEEGAWWWGELAFLAWRSGAADRLPDGAPQPYALHALGRWREAAEAWRHIGCPYESALALADSEEEADLREALDIFLRLGARPMAEVVSGRLRRLGARQISRGPRPSTRADPIGLTRRERQVLEMLGLGLTNAEIARRLVLSVRTVDRHVESVLRKTDARNRRAAVAVAARRRRPRQIG